MRPVLKSLRTKGILCVLYLDDLFIISKSIEIAREDCQFAKDLLESLGFLINFDKSCMNPSQQCTFLGFVFDSLSFTMSLPSEKSDNIVTLIATLLTRSQCSILKLAQLIGKLVSVCPTVDYGWMHLKILERAKYLALRKSNQNFNASILLSNTIKVEMRWWHHALTNNKGINIVLNRDFTLEIFSDASLTGWGAFCENTVTHGFWNETEDKNHINYLEVLAAFNALKSFASHLSDCSILLRIDNVTDIACINRMGSVKFKHLNHITRQIWEWCESKSIFVFASYINTTQNIYADRESRSTSIAIEYELSDVAFQEICFRFGTPTIDLFATQLNTKCSETRSRIIFSRCIYNIVEEWVFYAFPPFPLISKCLQKIIAEHACGIFVVPKWPTQPWYSL